MLCIYDSRAGRPQPVSPARRGELHTYLASPVTGDAQSDDLRSALLADVIRRVAERHRLRVTTWQRGPGVPTASYGRLNIHPPQASTGDPDPVDVAIAPAGAEVGAAAPGARWIRSASTVPGETAGTDPLALRLALMWYHHRQQAVVDADAVAASDRVLRTWREQVAEWARSPSKPLCARYVTDVLTAFEDDLDTPSALVSLQRLADDEEVPAGAKFEAFAHLDHLLGLDLAREVGR